MLLASMSHAMPFSVLTLKENFDIVVKTKSNVVLALSVLLS